MLIELLKILFGGLCVGLASSVTVGPVAVLCIQRTLSKGHLSGFMSGMGIYVSSGSACSKGHKSPVLTAMGLSDEIINSSIRVSLSRYTTEEELDAFVEASEKALKTLAKRR